MFRCILPLLILTKISNATEQSDFINAKNCDQIIDKQVYSICYDYKMKGAKYVAYTLYGSLVNKTNIEKRGSFYTEKNLAKMYRSNTRDYKYSGYDRGHLASDASFDYEKKVVRKTYSMANVVPMTPSVNRKSWFKAEKLERKVAVGLGMVHIVNGVVYSSDPQRIGKSKIAVPNGFWKMIYNDEKNYKRCFYYNNDLNTIPRDSRLRNHMIDCSELY